MTEPLVQQVLAGKSPHDRAVELINTTKIRDVAFPAATLYGGSRRHISAAHDPLIELARLVDAGTPGRSCKVAEEQSETKQQAHAAISRAQNALLGTSGYPDATFRRCGWRLGR